MTNVRVESSLGGVEENEPAIERFGRPIFIFLLLPFVALITGIFVFGPKLSILSPVLEPPPTWDRIAWFVLRCALYLGGVIATALWMSAAWGTRAERRAPERRAPERGLKLTPLPVAAACPFCKADLARADLGSGVIRCGDCEVAHHSECWQSHGGCTTLGCSCGPRERSEPTDVSVGPSR
jgi:hypothetical protein